MLKKKIKVRHPGYWQDLRSATITYHTEMKDPGNIHCYVDQAPPLTLKGDLHSSFTRYYPGVGSRSSAF